MTQTQNDLPGIPIETNRPAEVGSFVNTLPTPPLAGLNEAKAAAALHGVTAVTFLAAVINNPEYDITERVQAAAELLQFLAKGPF